MSFATVNVYLSDATISSGKIGIDKKTPSFPNVEHIDPLGISFVNLSSHIPEILEFFVLPGEINSGTIIVDFLSGNKYAQEYLITTSPAQPEYNNPNWSKIKPTEIVF